MKKTGHDIGGYVKRAFAVTFISAAVIAVCSAMFCKMPDILLKAASISAVFAMPEAAIEEIKTRFADEISQQQPNTEIAETESENEIKPTVEAILPKLPPNKKIETEEKSQPIEEIKKEPAPEIPEKYKGKVLTEDMSDREGNVALKIDNFRLRNYTPIPAYELEETVSQPSPIMLEDTSEPQVLIYHTHATESYCPYDDGYYDTRYNWRSTDNNNNMVAVGAVMAEVLRENGIAVIQDTQQHDYPSYDGSYANSYRSIKDNLETYPTIKVILDVHRDAIERESGLIIKPAIEYNGESYAQLMLVSNCDDGSGLLPHWQENLRFAASFSRELEQIVPNITRPILFSYRKYNQQLSNGALLLEFGTHANTMEEAQRTARVAGQALANALKSNGEK